MQSRLKLGVITPTRGDRPQFFEHCKYLLSRQSRQPDEIVFIDYPPRGPSPDITQRYRLGFEQLRGKVDVIAPFEDDDWYAPSYLALMVDAWSRVKSNMFGLSSHLIYHIIGRSYGTLRHENKAPMSNTLINAKALIRWPEDDFVLTDIHLWNQLKGITMTQLGKKPISISIKHGTGLHCTPSHKPAWRHYYHKDREMKYLRSIVEKKSFEFYRDFASSALQKFPYARQLSN